MLLGLGDLISDIAAGIERQEGFTSGACTKCVANNNPGALTAGPGQIGTSGGLAVFPDLATGQAALEHQVSLNVSRGLTLDQFFGGGTTSSGYYPGYATAAAGNDPATYAANVAAWAQIPSDVPLNALDTYASVPDGTDSPDWTGVDYQAPSASGVPAWAWMAAAGLFLVVVTR
jgi:hypothetical protein